MALVKECNFWFDAWIKQVKHFFLLLIGRRLIMLPAKTWFAAGLGLSLVATASHADPPPCELLPLQISTGYRDSFPFGADRIDTETRVTLTFERTADGGVTVRRTADTFLFQIGEKIAAQIDSVNRNLPKDRCGQDAAISSRDARVTPPTFTVTLHADASLNKCLPAPPSVQIPYPCGVDITGFPPHPIPRICYRPGPSLPAPPPARLGGGSVDGQFILNSSLAGSQVNIGLEKHVQSHLDNYTTFLSNLVLDPLIAHFAVDQINSALTGFANKYADKLIPELPKSIDMNGKMIDLEWTPKSSQFDAKDYQGNKLPVLVVVQEYTTDGDTACYLRDAANNLPR
jgi:hypothetical protein